MNPFDLISKQLHDGMIKGEMHGCLRDAGRLAGGYFASGHISDADMSTLRDLAEGFSLNAPEGQRKWDQAVEFGRNDPLDWDPNHYSPRSKEDRAFGWDDEIGGGHEEYRVVAEGWVESVDVETPADWQPQQQIIDYLSTLFDAEDHVGYVVDFWEKDGRKMPKRGAYDRTAGELIELLTRYKGDVESVFGSLSKEVGAWIRFNPLDGAGVRDANVTAFRYALVESDSMTIEQQRGVYDQLELPIAALVHSGNKSLHAIVKIDADDMDEYRKRVDFLYEVCKKNGLEIDRQNRNPSRLSRLPGVVRGENKQFLVATNLGKKSWGDWKDWIEEINDDLPDPEPMSTYWDNLPPLADCLIDGVLRQGHKMLVSGPSKAGKSFLLIELCAAIAEGREWLGRKCTKGRVLYVNLELDPASCMHRFHDVYESLGWEPKNISNLDTWQLRGKAIPMDRLAPKLIRRATKRKYSAIVIDPIYKVITGDENAADKMAHFCNQFDRVCHELGAAVIYCHHHSKGYQGGKRAADRSSGSGVFSRDPDAILDLIELLVSDDLRKQQENTAVCDLVADRLGDLVGDWDDHCGDDDRESEHQMRQLASRLLGPRYNDEVLPHVFEARQKVRNRSAWRVEGTLREFPKLRPVDLWFDYPVHSIDRDGVLQDADAEGAEPPWKQGKKSHAERSSSRKQERLESLETAYSLMADEVGAKLSDMAEYVDRLPRTVRGWIDESDQYSIKNGIVSRTAGKN